MPSRSRSSSSPAASPITWASSHRARQRTAATSRSA
ncbi:hypothetical protein EVA_13285 [gut metagenome]|uniref:Uncharacterized protein n=1 Tax=gut metagenome TaxID=749906 RepID=J9FVR7_9ZZZZ